MREEHKIWDDGAGIEHPGPKNEEDERIVLFSRFVLSATFRKNKIVRTAIKDIPDGYQEGIRGTLEVVGVASRATHFSHRFLRKLAGKPLADVLINLRTE